MVSFDFNITSISHQMSSNRGQNFKKILIASSLNNFGNNENINIKKQIKLVWGLATDTFYPLNYTQNLSID